MDYEKLKIKGFKYWDLYLHKNQFPYIGRCYAWAKNNKADKINDMTKEEQNELFEIIIPRWNNSIEKSFGKQRPNIACFGNTSPHLHWHFIPRYNKKIIFKGEPFIPVNPGKNYAPYPKTNMDSETLQEIKDLISINL
ncbi:hypothetical protein KKC45_00270 [Patescibacteria group bacterium]|nr:hypothetical protein [Patescibacteria group bacterium]